MARLALLALILFMGFLSSPAAAHEEHHPTKADEPSVNYSDWKNLKGDGCCNNQDCRPIADEDVQESPVTKVFIENKWCPVLNHHYLKQGNAPDWSRNHICVRKLYNADPGTTSPAYLDPCQRLLCFQPRPRV
ncbi:hypothetical protein K8Q93_03035 [Candidatus Parcubacteria bacterium]|nr:hypothetical protein [Candidatus Parcubacteria bacterium]